MKETIKEFGNYIITDSGTVANKQTGRIKKPTSNHSGKGYLYVDLYNNGIRKRFYVHRLVAETFIPNPLSKPYVNHIDGDTQNNNVANLEWCTPLENVEHASKVLGVMKQYEEANRKREKPVWQIDYQTGNKIKMFPSIRAAERETGIKSQYITQICKNKFNQCFGYSWCYAEEIEECSD